MFIAMLIRSVLLSPWIYRLIRWALAGIFLYSGILKLMDPKSFSVIIEAYGLIPDSWTMIAAVFLSVCEVVAALCLIWDIRWSLEVITGLLILFMMILGYGIFMGLDVDCGCFGPDDPEQAFSGLRSALYRDFVMMMGVMYLYIFRVIRKNLKNNSI